MVKNLPANAGDTGCGLDLTGGGTVVGKSPGGRKWQPTPVSLPGKYHAQRSLAAAAHEIAKTQLTTHACKPVMDST